MFSILAYPELIERALQDAAWTAKHGTREEQSGRFLPPPGWKGHCITGAPGEIEAYRARRPPRTLTTQPDHPASRTGTTLQP